MFAPTRSPKPGEEAGTPDGSLRQVCCMKHRSNPQPATKLQPSLERRQRDGGYLLLAIMLMMALMVIAATVAAPRYVQQIKRDREEEMIHRGVQYARAIKKFYKKNGRYPASLDDLDKGQIKFLRQRYKDPLTKDGKWKLLNYGDIQMLLNTGAPGTPAASLGTLGGSGAAGGVGSSSFSNSNSPGGFSQSPLQAQQQQQQQNPGAVTGGFPSNSDQGNNSEGQSNNFGGNSSNGSTGFTLNSNNGQPGNSGSNQAGGTNSASGNQSSGASGSNGQTFGGGAIVGVASLSKDPTIRIYNKKKTYNEWQFIYNPVMDQANVLIKGPYQPTTIGGNQQIGTPASQMNGQQQSQNPFGQSSSPFGQQNNNSSFGQQNGIGTQNTPQSSPSPQ